MNILKWLQKEAKVNPKLAIKYHVINPLNRRVPVIPIDHVGITKKDKSVSKRRRIMCANSQKVNRGGVQGRNAKRHRRVGKGR